MISEIHIAIDAFRLVSEPQTSGAFMVSEIIREIHPYKEITQIIILLPRKPDAEFLFKDLLSIKKINILFPEKEQHPEKNFRGNIHWIQFVIPQLLKNIPVTHLISPYHQTPLFLRRSIKVITIINDICGILPSAGYFYHKKGPYRHWFNFFTALFRSDAFIYISHYSKNVFENFFSAAAHKPSLVIYPKPTVNDAANLLDIERNLLQFGLQAKEYFFAFGTIGPRKGTDLTVKAFDLYQKRGGKKKLLLLAPPSALNYIQNLIQKFKNFAISVSKLTNAERDTAYAGAIALIFPSRCEGFGYPILEAMSQGCPPIALRNSPADEIIGGQVPSLNSLEIDEIVNFMFMYENSSLVDQEDRASKMKLRANEFIAQINSAQNYIDLIQLLKQS